MASTPRPFVAPGAQSGALGPSRLIGNATVTVAAAAVKLAQNFSSLATTRSPLQTTSKRPTLTSFGTMAASNRTTPAVFAAVTQSHSSPSSDVPSTSLLLELAQSTLNSVATAISSVVASVTDIGFNVVYANTTGHFHKCPNNTDGHHQTLLLPLFGDEENSWPIPLRAFLYLFGLLNIFVGVSYGVDIFMGAIEKITSQTVTVKIKNPIPGGPTTKKVPFWNTTVATLTLGAAGTCSPEILLTTIETVGHNFDAGKLGPGTIIGSAAFNLMITVAFCIISVPSNQTRRIEQLPVYITTTLFSIFAYLWLIFVLAINGPATIHMWEAAVTFLLFFVLVITAYLVDRRFCSKRKKSVFEQRPPKTIVQTPLAELHKEEEKEIAEAHKEADHQETVHPAGPDESSCANGHANAENGEISHAYADLQRLKSAKQNGLRSPPPLENGVGDYKNQLHANNLSAVEASLDGPRNSSLCNTQQPRKLKKQKSWIYYRLHRPPPFAVHRIADLGMLNLHVMVANIAAMTSQQSKDAVIEFAERLYHASIQDQQVNLKLVRRGNLMLVCTLLYEVHAPGKTGRPKKCPLADAIVFREGEVEKHVAIDIPFKHITASGKFSVKLCLADTNDERVLLGPYAEAEVNLSAPTNNSDMRVTTSEHKLAIVADSSVDSSENQSDVGLDDDSEETLNLTWREAWADQFRNAVKLSVTGRPQCFDYSIYIFSVGWRILLAFVPPPQLGAGYPTFICALGFIAIMETLVGDMAQIFGCICGLDDVVVAAMFVSVGTNLPDLFASRFAAISDKTADTAIGHISGGTSVNVFLGLGIPWLAAAIFHEYTGTTADTKVFHVDSEDLWSCVVVYSFLSIMCITILFIRRRLPIFGGAELGGPRKMKIVSCIILVIMWLAYVGFTYLQSQGLIRMPQVTTFTANGGGGH